MQPERRDVAFLWDMREAARDVVSFTTGVTPDQFTADIMRRMAVGRQLSVIGEAARRVSLGFREAHPEIPWHGIVGLRNVLIHEYGEFDPDRIWDVATQEVPELIGLLDPLIPPPPEDDPE